MQEVQTGVVQQNIREGNRVNLFDFPAPFLHEKDGGRYIGTGHLVITKDPDSDWINVGTYRILLHDHNTAGIYIGPGKHASFPRQKYFDIRVLFTCLFRGSSTRRVNDGSMMRPYAIS
jgi:UbiD family decarboxylase